MTDRPILPENDARGVVHPDEGFRHFELLRFPPEPPLDRFIDRYWVARWDLVEPFDQKVVSFPAVHVIFEDGDGWISTVWREEFVRHLEGRGQVVAVMFRPGGFEPFLGAPVSTIAERQLDLDEVFGPAGHALAVEVGAAGRDLPAALDRMHRFFAERVPAGPTVGETVSEVVELVQNDPSLGRVGDLAERLGTSTRQVQRLFARHVGATPKFVIQRARVQLAAEAARRHDLDWARLAAELGYSDQSHLTRSFTETVGTPPATYRAAIGTNLDEPG